MKKHSLQSSGFTLIELSMVLVIIGLLAGGVLVGRDMIEAAKVRKTVAQIINYNTAISTFRGKYNTLPADMSPSKAAMFGFQPRAGSFGRGNEDGRLDACAAGLWGQAFAGCETVLFWRDLSEANLIGEGFTTATDNWAVNLSSDQLPLYFPKAPIEGNYILVGSGGINTVVGWTMFGITGVSATGAGSGFYTLNGALSAAQAFGIDTKIDDGSPVNGSVQATVASGNDWARMNFSYCRTGPFRTGPDYDLSSSNQNLCGLVVRISNWPQ